MGNSKSRIVSIEGNIGSGKSTLLAHLRQHFKDDTGIVFVDEPVQEWDSVKDSEGNTMLKKFYSDQDKYAFSFQMMAYISRLALLKKAMEEHPGAIIITERSLYTDKYVFAKMLYDMGKIEDVNYQIYSKWFDAFLEECKLSQIIYVRTEPVICCERIKKRSRNGEDSISIDYLEKCHIYHNYMIEEFEKQAEMNNVDSYILTLDGNINIHANNTIQIEKWKDEIMNFIGV